MIWLIRAIRRIHRNINLRSQALCAWMNVYLLFPVCSCDLEAKGWCWFCIFIFKRRPITTPTNTKSLSFCLFLWTLLHIYGSPKKYSINSAQTFLYIETSLLCLKCKVVLKSQTLLSDGWKKKFTEQKTKYSIITALFCVIQTKPNQTKTS